MTEGDTDIWEKASVQTDQMCSVSGLTIKYTNNIVVSAPNYKMEASLRDGLPCVCIHPVESMQPLGELTFLHKNPAVQPISLCIAIISLSVAA